MGKFSFTHPRELSGERVDNPQDVILSPIMQDFENMAGDDGAKLMSISQEAEQVSVVYEGVLNKAQTVYINNLE